MDALAIFNEIFLVLVLLGVIALLWAIWQSSERRTTHIEAMERTLVEVATKDAESARQAVETTRILAAIVQNQQATK